MILAVYGSLKQGFHNHGHLKRAKLLGEFVTPPIYTMYDYGGFPAATLNGNTPLMCEIYEVNDQKSIDSINMLEGFYGNVGDPRNFYDITTVETPFGEANMYYMNRSIKGRDTIDDGVWKHKY